METAHPGDEMQFAYPTGNSRGLAFTGTQLARVLRVAEPRRKQALLVGLVAGTLAVFAFDFALPQTLAPEVLYAALVLGSLWMRQPRLTGWLAAASTLLIVLADLPRLSLVVLGNHSLAILQVWVTAALVVGVHGFLTEIQAHAATLERRVQARTAELSTAVQQLETQSTQLRALASEVTLAEQRERQRLATVLHDEHQQLLVGAQFRLALLERAEDGIVRDVCHEVAALLERAIEHARSLTRELSPPILSAGGLVPALEGLVRRMAETHHLNVELVADKAAVPDTEDLALFLFQSVRELLFNVVKHAKVSAAEVTLTRQDDAVCIQVTDRGVGFDPGALPAAGDPTGGFGLFSIHQRSTLLGGRLEIVSARGQGSRFTLVAPLQRPRPTEPAARPATPVCTGPAVETPPTPGRTGKIRVLVVDDHQVVRQGLMRLLAATPDIEVVGEAGDGKTAVDLTQQLGPDVLLMDVSMPVMNGIEATRLIRTRHPSARVIGLSMFKEDEQAQAMRDAGAVAYLTKSRAADDLVAAIRACVGQEHAHIPHRCEDPQQPSGYPHPPRIAGIPREHRLPLLQLE